MQNPNVITWKSNTRPRPIPSFDRLALGKRVRRLRQERRWTVVELAERSGVQEWIIHRCESGRSNTRLENLVPLARALGVTLDYLVHGEPSAPLTPAERQARTEDVARALAELPDFASLSLSLYDALARLGRQTRTCRHPAEGG
jgi:transcriptional regulator with XRE-family HTH domain